MDFDYTGALCGSYIDKPGFVGFMSVQNERVVEGGMQAREGWEGVERGLEEVQAGSSCWCCCGFWYLCWPLALQVRSSLPCSGCCCYKLAAVRACWSSSSHMHRPFFLISFSLFVSPSPVVPWWQQLRSG
ncbi:TPA: hypothetical protein ACH3X3_000115 [Trebouxia sp. C0006]